MRQFVFGLLVAALGYWGYQKWFVPESGRVVRAGTETPAAPAAALDELLPKADGGVEVADSPAGGRESALHSGDGTADADPQAAAKTIAELLPRIEAREAAAVATGWAVIASGNAKAEHERVLQALAPRGDDVAALLKALGDDNSFLHSDAGRGAARAALAAAMALPDQDALTAGTQLLYLMTRGRIERGDVTARQVVDEAYQQHRIRVDRWLCNPANVAGARSYTVASGDNLDRIAAKFRREGLTVEAGTLAVLNRIHNPNALQVGQKLKVPAAKITAIVEKRSYAMLVFVGDQLLRLYWIGHGANDRTPVTEFTVVAKQPRPEWTAPDGNVYPYGHPENILGEYFIKFGHPQYAGFGAHGTPMPETIGTMSSMGCIRMFAADIAELFLILPRDAQVAVRATESLR